MLLFAGLLLRILFFGAQVVPAAGLRFNFTDVQQCDSITISFAGSNKTDATPVSLSILPLNQSAIVIPLPNPSIVSTGIALNFLPFPAGTNFVATLDDDTGDNVIPVSDLIRVLPSVARDTSCIASTNNVQRQFSVISAVTQCEPVTIQYNTTNIPQAPTVRLYNPKGPSFPLELLSDDTRGGRATYMMKFFRGQEIVLLMDGGRTFRETTPLITIMGDSASDNSCFDFNFTNTPFSGNNAADNLPPATGPNSSNTRTVIIGSASGGGALLLVGLCMAMFVLRHRRRRAQQAVFSEKHMEMGPDNEKATASIGQFHATEVLPPQQPRRNPIYTAASFMSGGSKQPRDVDRSSMTSWAQVIPNDQRSPPSILSQDRFNFEVQSRRSADNITIQSLDIEGMLNMATLQSEISRNNSTIAFPEPSLARTPEPSFLRPQTSRRHLRDPSDVPIIPTSMAFSNYSDNPFENARSSVTPSIQNPVARPSGLPSSPRQGRVVSSSSNTDWYTVTGIAR